MMEPSHRKIRRVLLVALLVNLALAFGKLYAGWRLDSLALLADALHSLLGAATCTITLMTWYLGAIPPVENPGRNRKFEMLATLAIGGLLLLGCWELVGSVAQSLLDPAVPPSYSAGGILFLLAALGVNFALSRYQHLLANELNGSLFSSMRGDSPESKRIFFSSAVATEAAQFKTQLLTTALTLVSLLSVKTGWLRFDAIAAVVIVILVGLAVYALIYERISHLVDANREPPVSDAPKGRC